MGTPRRVPSGVRERPAAGAVGRDEAAAACDHGRVSESEHPELAGYEPGDGRPLRSATTMRVFRVVIVMSVVVLLIPIVGTTVGVQARTASQTCTALVAASGAPDAQAVVGFDLMGPAGPGWYCTARMDDRREVLVGALGLIPG